MTMTGWRGGLLMAVTCVVLAGCNPDDLGSGSGAATGTASLSWTAPNSYTDGGTLQAAELASYYVYHGTTPGTFDEIHVVSGAAATSFELTGLAPGPHYFAVSAVTVSGQESALSATGHKTIM
jgi:hypothetical protein